MVRFKPTACTIALAAATISAALAQDYPTRPVRIVTATPGGGNDYLARIIAPPLGSVLGQQVIVDNRPSRLVGGIVARATADGYTLVVGGGTMQFTPLMEPRITICLRTSRRSRSSRSRRMCSSCSRRSR